LLPAFLLLASCFLLALLASSCAPADQPSPRILSVESEGLEVGRYGKFELAVALEATYDNPYDVRQVDLTAVFTGPDGREWAVPGFWDGDEAWRVRFTPSAEGEWRYSVQVRDRHGESKPAAGRFTCLPSGDHGWLQVGDWVDPAYSARYLAYHDGTPFYSNPFFATRYDRYSLPDLRVIDLVVEDAARSGIHLVFTIWNHDLLRDETHAWGDGVWETRNGFRE
jgi:hypothetical protein